MKVLFLSEKSVLDTKSGAAIELLTWLQFLTAAGHECYSFSFSCFDGQEQYPVSEQISNQINLARDHGRLCNLDLDGIKHTLLLTKSTRTEDLGDPELMSFNANAKAYIDEVKPDAIICFGSQYLAPILRHAKAGGCRPYFYLGVGSYDEKVMPAFEAVDGIIVPTEELKRHYKEKLGLKGMRVIPTSPNHSWERTADDLSELAATRRDKFVTMINPHMHKGGLIFINIAHRFMQIDPTVNFLAVESRGTRQGWIDVNIDLTAIENLWWIPKQKRIENVFRRTSVLVVPSISHEAAGKVISEAMVCGIPVISSDTGGIPEQMRGAGQVIPLPDNIAENYMELPEGVAETWTAAVQRLLDDEEYYLKKAKESLKAGKLYRRSRVAKEVAKLFEGK